MRTRHQPYSMRSCELLLRAVGAAEGHLGGASFAWVCGFWNWALSHAQAPVLGACGRGPLPTGCGCGQLWAWGPDTNPTVRALACWLCALWRQHRGTWGRGGGSPLAWVFGVQGLGAPPRPTNRPWGLQPGPATHLPLVGQVWAWAPITSPTARPLASWFCALLGRLEGARERGGALAWVLGVRSWALSHARPPVLGACGRGQLTTGCGCGKCGRGDPSPTPPRALLRAGFARCGVGFRAPGRGASRLGVGRPGLGALPRPTARPCGGLAGAVGVRTRHQHHSVRSCELALRAVGATGGHPGGGHRLPGCEPSGAGALSHPRPIARPYSLRPGPATHWLWVGFAGVGARFSLAPVPVPRFVVCCARVLGLRHLVAIFAWHQSLCLGCGRRTPLWRAL